MHDKSLIKSDERLDDLECKSLFIIQKKGGYAFTGDAVLLANSVKATSGETVVDLGTGSGVIATIVAAKTKAKVVYGIEIQESLADRAKRSVIYNGLEDVVKIKNMDMRKAPDLFKGVGVDVVVVNPPYFKWDGAEVNEKNIARSEIAITLEEIVKVASDILKFGGRFYMISKTERLVDALFYMRKYKIEPKTLRMVVPKPGKTADTFIVEGRKNGQEGFKVIGDLVVRNSDGELTDEARRMYGK